ncbi:hypothetical protein EGW08_002574, partial [Elysia chlorotica]
NCNLPIYIIVGIAVTSSFALLAGLFLVVVIRYRCRQKQFECEETSSEEDIYERSIPISSLPVAPVLYPTGISLVQAPPYERVFLQPHHLPRLPGLPVPGVPYHHNNGFVSS